MVDVFHGDTQPISVAIREAVASISPNLHRLVHQTPMSKSAGLEHAWRVMCEFQQDYFAHLGKLALGGTPAVPDFQHILTKFLTFRVSSLAELPHAWYSRVEGRGQSAPSGGRTSGNSSGNLGSGNGGSGSPIREQTGTTPRVNPRPDAGLMTRFQNCGHMSISSMIGGCTVEHPKHNGKDICLAWALKEG